MTNQAIALRYRHTPPSPKKVRFHRFTGVLRTITVNNRNRKKGLRALQTSDFPFPLGTKESITPCSLRASTLFRLTAANRSIFVDVSLQVLGFNTPGLSDCLRTHSTDRSSRRLLNRLDRAPASIQVHWPQTKVATVSL